MELSRTEQKRRIKELEKLVVELVELPSTLLKQISGFEEAGELIEEAGTLKGGARKRQIKYITKLLKQEPVDELYELLSRHRGAALVEKKRFKEVEYLRDALLNEALEKRKSVRQAGGDWEEDWTSRTVVDICRQLPAVEPQTLLRLSYLFAQTRNPKHSRELFRYLRSVQEQQERK